MWWLSFFGGDVVIIEAASLAHARLLAAATVLGRASHFGEGHSISSGLATLIPDNFLRSQTISSDGYSRQRRPSSCSNSLNRGNTLQILARNQKWCRLAVERERGRELLGKSD
jgi:hypothetical protein